MRDSPFGIYGYARYSPIVWPGWRAARLEEVVDQAMKEVRSIDDDDLEGKEAWIESVGDAAEQLLAEGVNVVRAAWDLAHALGRIEAPPWKREDEPPV